MPAPVQVLRSAPVGPPGVIAGLDGSDGSLWALDRAFAEAAAHRLPLYVVAAVNPAPGGYAPGMAELVQDSVERVLDGMSAVVARAVVSVRENHPVGPVGRAPQPPTSVHVVLGDTVEVLLQLSAGHHTLVVGARGNGGFNRLLLGSIATAVTHHATCPVLVVPSRNTGPEPLVLQSGRAGSGSHQGCP